jgi:hypothetical protein
MNLDLRIAEWINLAAFSWFIALAWLRKDLDRGRKRRITAIGVGGVAIILFIALVLPHLGSRFPASVTRDWIPYLLLLMFYWQAGQFVTHADKQIEEKLMRLDARLVAPLLEWCVRRPAGIWILSYLELAYLFCYVSMPLGLAALYLIRQGQQADQFWAVVLAATYPCYALLPFMQTRPPRMLAEEWSKQLPHSKVRAFNLWILRHASIHANTFPSAHVATATACALTLLSLAPVWVGLVFLWVAFSIALGAVTGRYHYAADAILGTSVALAAFLIVRPLVVYGTAG